MMVVRLHRMNSIIRNFVLYFYPVVDMIKHDQDVFPVVLLESQNVDPWVQYFICICIICFAVKTT